MTILFQTVVVICAGLLIVMAIATGLVAALRLYYQVETITPEKIREQWSFDTIPERYRTGDPAESTQAPVRSST